MLIKADAAQLEWRIKVFLAQDKIAIAEILDPTRDIHQENKEVFKLPNRTIAKNFLYRMIFADAFGEQGPKGPAYAYVNDPNFSPTSTSIKFWTAVIERFFEKYPQIYQHSVSLIKEGCERGFIQSPSGRVYRYSPYTKRNGEIDWPRTQMLNHIVQGFSADVMVLARRIIYKNWDKSLGLLINTVHDDIEADVPNNPGTIFGVACLMEDSAEYIPEEAKKWFDINLNVPMEFECKFGMNLHESSMRKFNRNTFSEDFKKYNENNNH